MADHEGTNGNGATGNDLELARDLDDWIDAGRGIFRMVENLGRLIPPFGRDRAAELGQIIASTHAEFERLCAAWTTIIRPALVRFEEASHPGWILAGHGAPRHVPVPPALPVVPGDDHYTDGYWVDHWSRGSDRLLTLVTELRACIPPGDNPTTYYSIATFHLPRVDEQFAWVTDGYNTAVRPRLKKYQRRNTRW